jgi:hypothetical protein
MNEKQADYDIWTVDPENGIRQNITKFDNVSLAETPYIFVTSLIYKLV